MEMRYASVSDGGRYREGALLVRLVGYLLSLSLIFEYRRHHKLFFFANAVPFFTILFQFHEIFCSVTPILPIVCCILYGLQCTVGRQYMANRKPFDLRWALFVWNLSLSIFRLVAIPFPTRLTLSCPYRHPFWKSLIFMELKHMSHLGSCAIYHYGCTAVF